MKKTLSILLAMLLLLSLTACGSDPNEGVYEAKSAELGGISINVEKVFKGGFSVELKSGGKAVLRMSGEEYNVKWSLDGTAFKLTASDSEYTGTLSDGVIKLENILNSGVNMTLEKTK